MPIQTLGMLLTRRMERAGLKPQGFVANDYRFASGRWPTPGALFAKGAASLGGLFGADMLGDDLEEWLQESALMKRSFRNCAIMSGLIERNFLDRRKTGREVKISTDLIYDVCAAMNRTIFCSGRARRRRYGPARHPRLAQMLTRVRANHA